MSSEDASTGPAEDRSAAGHRTPAAGGGAGSPRRGGGSGWLSEARRSLAATGLAALALVVALLVPAADRLSALDHLVVVLLAYLLVYLVLTLTAFGRAGQEDIRRWADRDGRGSLLQRYVLGTAPGPGVSIIISVLALVTSVVWMPGTGTDLGEGARVGLAIAVVSSAWACVVVAFAVCFRADNLLEDGQALDFPGRTGPGWSDHIYFGLSVMTTFGATDVSVTSPQMRKTVTVNAVIAFAFNTVIVAAVVSAIT